MEEFDVTIIGAGIVGLAIASECSELIGIDSPGFTAAPAIARDVIDSVRSYLK